MFEFMWHVPTGGFEWVTAEAWAPGNPPVPYAARFLEPRMTGVPRSYHPLTDAPALFRTFADVAPTEAAIQEFANRYGGLGVVEAIRPSDSPPSQGESFERWGRELRSLKAVLHLWEALTENRYEDLRRWMSLQPGAMDELTEWDRVIRYVPDHLPPEGPEVLSLPHVRLWAAPDTSAGLQWVWSAGDTGTPSGDPTTRDVPTTPTGLALTYVRELVNWRLRDHTGMRLLDREAAPGTTPLGLSAVPTNLLGAIWLQCARAIEGVGRYQRCPQCLDWFAVHPKAMRENTSYCSTRCRVAAFRARREKGSESRVC
jgi:hypothetical protein